MHWTRSNFVPIDKWTGPAYLGIKAQSGDYGPKNFGQRDNMFYKWARPDFSSDMDTLWLNTPGLDTLWLTIT